MRAIVHRLLEDGDDPNAWTVTYVWAGDAAEPVYAVLLEDAERVRAFTVWPEGDGDGVKEILEAQKLRHLGVTTANPRGLHEYVKHHLARKAKKRKVTAGWIKESRHQLDRAVEYFGTDRPITSILPEHVEAWWEWLSECDNRRGGKLSDGTIRHHLNTLSNLYRRAHKEELVPPGFNPVAALDEKPSAATDEADWLEVPDAARLLEAARTYRAKRAYVANPWHYEVIATFLLTGGRKKEVLGLEVDDVSFDRNTVTFRTNEHRRLKTRRSNRVVPLMPQLRPILQRHVFERGNVSGLLFQSHHGPGMAQGLRKTLDAVGERASFARGYIRTKVFRHTFCAAALQTLDGGAPISTYTVARWMGHGGRSLVDRIYGHLGDIRHRSDHVEYRVGQHEKVLSDRLEALRLSQ